MTAPVVASPLAVSIPLPPKKKRVLLVDTSTVKRGLRAETMRKLGMEVDCAADLSEARCWWRADLYNLVLIDMESELGRRDRFCEDMRGATPPQQLAFLVGTPDYLANAPNADVTLSAPTLDDQNHWGDVKAALATDLSGDTPQRWGIMEASRRISAVRSLYHARSQAVRERPTPPRDPEVRLSRRDTASRTLDQMLGEDPQ
jgi:CheY-like chemotaxis protein